IVGLYCLSFLRRRNIKWAAFVSIALVTVVGFMFNTPDSRLKARYQEAVQDIRDYRQGHTDTSLGARFVMWEGALSGIAKRPLLGWSHADYQVHLKQMVDADELAPVALNFSNNLHN